MSATPSQHRLNHIPPLTGVRAIAAYLVFLHHYNPLSTQVDSNILAGMFKEFHIGVTMFFVLSGFLITYRYYGSGPINFKAYIRNRFARIYPIFFLLTIATLVLDSRGTQPGPTPFWPIVLTNFSLTKGYFNELKFSLVPQAWSLTVEETFYLLAPLFFFFVRKKTWSLILIPPAFLGAGFALINLFGGGQLWGFFENAHFMISYTFFGRCTEFVIGMALALHLLSKPAPHRLKFATYLGGAGILAAAFWLASIRGTEALGINQPLGKVINNLFLPMAIALFYFGLVMEKTYISRLLSTKTAVLLGKSSYAFYLIHMGFIYAVVDHRITPYLWLQFVFINILSIGLWHFIEEPLNHFIKRKTKALVQ